MATISNTNQATLSVSPAMALGVQDIYTQSSTQLLPLGTRVCLSDGRKFVYGQAGEALAYAKVTQSAIPSANWDNQAVTTAGAVGDQQITVTFGGAITANFFANGYCLVNDANGEGNIYTIKSNTAGTSGVVLTFYEKIRVAITTSGEVTCYPHPCKGLIIAPTTLTAALCGVPQIAVTDQYYAWFQVAGPCPVLVAATLSLATTCEVATTAGGVIPSAETTFGPVVGHPLILAAATEYALINLQIPGY
jgi:hypothetical protein